VWGQGVACGSRASWVVPHMYLLCCCLRCTPAGAAWQAYSPLLGIMHPVATADAWEVAHACMHARPLGTCHPCVSCHTLLPSKTLLDVASAHLVMMLRPWASNHEFPATLAVFTAASVLLEVPAGPAGHGVCELTLQHDGYIRPAAVPGRSRKPSHAPGPESRSPGALRARASSPCTTDLRMALAEPATSASVMPRG
jgi:hypothetical protein